MMFKSNNDVHHHDMTMLRAFSLDGIDFSSGQYIPHQTLMSQFPGILIMSSMG